MHYFSLCPCKDRYLLCMVFQWGHSHHRSFAFCAKMLKCKGVKAKERSCEGLSKNAKREDSKCESKGAIRFYSSFAFTSSRFRLRLVFSLSRSITCTCVVCQSLYSRMLLVRMRSEIVWRCNEEL